MSARIAVARAVFDGLYASGLSHVLRPMTQGEGVIFCLHHVTPEKSPDSFAPNGNLEITPGFLDEMLTFLKGRGYAFLSLADAARELAHGRRRDKPFAVFTLDDGYLDNLVHAQPVFERHVCPFTVYVCTGLVDGTTEMWWRALENILRANSGKTLTAAGVRVAVGDGSAAPLQSAWDRLFPLLQNLPEHGQRHWIRQEAQRAGLDLAALCKASLMSWDEIRVMAKSPLATIGAHTLNHFAISRLDADEAFEELRQSKLRIEREIGKAVPHFAFPYGNVAHAGPRDFALARRAGFETAVTTRLGTVFPGHAEHLHALPRVLISSRFDRMRWLQVLAYGTAGFVANKGKRLNTA